MRNRYFVCYDIADPQRLVQMYKKMQGYGDPVQYSVFSCDLSPKELLYMQDDINNHIVKSEDRVLIINSGSTKKINEQIITMGIMPNTKIDTAVII